MNESSTSLNGGELHSLLLLSLIAEPDAHDILLELELLGDLCDLLAGRPRLQTEVHLERALLGRRYGRAFAFTVSNGGGDARR